MEDGERERDAEMPQLPRFVAAAAAVIVVWRGKERVDTTQLSSAKEERWRTGDGEEEARLEGKV